MIGVFDSGLGGLRVLKALQAQLPACGFLYFGDTAGGPYDDKSPDRVAALTAEGLSRLEKMGAGLLVVADHAAAACLTIDTRKRFDIPLVDIVSHGIVPGTGALTTDAVGIIGPEIVDAAGAHRSAVENALPDARIFFAAAPLLAPLVGAGWLKKPETVMIAKKYLHFLKLRQIQSLVLGSNHYSLISSVLQRKIGKRVRLVSGIPELAMAVKNMLEEQPELKGRCAGDGSCRPVVSDLTDSMKKNARIFYGKNIQLDRI